MLVRRLERMLVSMRGLMMIHGLRLGSMMIHELMLESMLALIPWLTPQSVFLKNVCYLYFFDLLSENRTPNQ
jgi:hypothetical protein